jgi:hypothetical protein
MEEKQIEEKILGNIEEKQGDRRKRKKRQKK